ncbi:MAG: CPBP family intramembrane metalloprotease [Lachnospiraceae bacterium]|nr:CPBP family intramembrane metalloprotease [Lachnospiraceae bacterium]
MKEVRRASWFLAFIAFSITAGVYIFTPIILLIVAKVGSLVNLIQDEERFITEVGNNNLILTMAMHIFMICSCFIFIGKFKLWKNVRFKLIGPLKVFLLVILTYSLYPVINLIAIVASLFSENVLQNALGEYLDSTPFYIMFLMMAVMPPIGEELIFRGIFLSSHDKVNKIGAILISAVLFGIFHGNINQFVYAAFLGIILAIVVEITDSIYSSMIIHFVFNGTETVMIYLLPKLIEVLKKIYPNTDPSEFEMAENTVIDKAFVIEYLKSSWLVVLTSLAFSAFIIWLLALVCHKNLKEVFFNCEKTDGAVVSEEKDNQDEQESDREVQHYKEKERIITIPLVLAFLIMLGYMVYVELRV